MMETKLAISQELSWYKALTLSERLASIRSSPFSLAEKDIDRQLAEERLKEWRSQPPFESGDTFAMRLVCDGLTEEQFVHILGEPAEAIRERLAEPPEWLSQIETAYSRTPPAAPNLPLEKNNGHSMNGLLGLIEPLLFLAREELVSSIQASTRDNDKIPFDPKTISDVLAAHLPELLLRYLSRTMVLELNVARLQGQLVGDTPEERYQSFIERLCNHDTALAILEEYPVLARQVVRCIGQWKTNSLNFIQRLCGDAETLQDMFSPQNELGLLVELKGSGSDRHQGGQTVFIARFSSGLQLVYKPRSLAVDVHFQELLTWLNKRGDQAPFKTLKILDRGSHGWVEYVEAHGCAHQEEVERFYTRQGGYLALLYALEATDFHNENIIAAGEQPVLVDLEALFHARVEGESPAITEEAAIRDLSYSVLNIGLLPGRAWANLDGVGVDISGLGGAAGQTTPFHRVRWEKAGTDQMHLARKPVVMTPANNRPSLNGLEVDAHDYTDAILNGFIQMYRLLVEHRHELLSAEGPLARFAQDRVRVIIRPTSTYSSLLDESFHPDVLRDALDRDRLFDSLWLAVKVRPNLARVISAERDALLNGDIPIFYTHPESRDVWSPAGEKIPELLDQPGLALASERVQELGENNLALQVWLIRASLVTAAPVGDYLSDLAYELPEPKKEVTPERLIELACSVGDRISEMALHSGEDIYWFGLAYINHRQWILQTLRYDLYDGMPGIILFLAYLGSITQKPGYTSLAQSALASLRRWWERNPALIKSVSGYVGYGGIIYLLTHLGVLWNRYDLVEEAEALVEHVLPLIDQDEELDFINGSAGCIVSLVGLYHYIPSNRVLKAAFMCGDRLIQRAENMPQGVGWRADLLKSTPLASMAHGSAGIAFALLQLANLTGAQRFRFTALEGIRYVRSLFSAEGGNWFDLRASDNNDPGLEANPPKFSTSWCSGAAGIGMAFLNSLPYSSDEETRADIQAAVTTTLAYGVGHNHTLCHGDLGNLEFLFQAGQLLDDQLLKDQVNRMASVVCESTEQHGWVFANSLKIESPGLMTGLAGIGYSLLRLARPSLVPSVLILAPPPSATS